MCKCVVCPRGKLPWGFDWTWVAELGYSAGHQERKSLLFGGYCNIIVESNMGNVVDGIFYTDIRPIPESKPRFDPQLGFKNGRKERVLPPVTPQELEAAKVEKVFRDYCAHYYMNVLACKEKHYPLMYKCAPVLHEHAQCEFQDYILRMKEFERERRLLAREQRKMQAQATAGMAHA